MGDAPDFTITLRSVEITKPGYHVEGYGESWISATPAAGTQPGAIRLTIADGTSVRLKGLGQGDYTVAETGNANYDLSAKCGPMYGAAQDVAVENSGLTLTLDREKRLELTNTRKAICKITVNETEMPFYTLQSAMEYARDNLSASAIVTIQMLTDYLMPSSDQPVIPSDYKIVLNTADITGGTYNFDGGSSGTSSGAAITRAPGFISGAMQSTLIPITDSDLQLSVGKSVKLLFPGGLTGRQYTLAGGFTTGGDAGTAIPVRQTGAADTTLTGADRASFTLSSGKTGGSAGSTVDVIFGGQKPICKIVADEEATGTAYLFSSLSQAVAFAQKVSLNNAAIELLVDYLIPGSDSASVPAGLNLTFRTAIGDTAEDCNYSADPAARATVSRDNGNTSSFIVAADGNNNTRLSVQNLVFDGKNFAGKIEGGVIKTKNCKVEISDCVFRNCIANDRGRIKVEFDPDGENYQNATLSVTGSSFINCKSEGSLRQGGGAIWTNACSFTLTGEKDADGNYVSGIFDSCTANDQGGAVFHRIDWMYDEAYRTNSEANITACKFINCQAKAAGGLEFDSYAIDVSDCWTENCQATARNAGGFNVYIQYKPNNNPNEGDDMNPPVSATGETELTLSRCVIKDCTAGQAGGGFRTLTHKTTLIDCTFTNNTAGSNRDNNGGGVSITNYKNTAFANRPVI